LSEKNITILSKINLNNHAPPNWQKIISKKILKENIEKGTELGIIVLVGDIRKSTSIMKESISMIRFGEILTKFVKSIKVSSFKNNAWFDKFTGDGFIIYWIYDKKIEKKNLCDLFKFCQTVFNWFSQTMDDFRENSKNFPSRAGLCLGIDSGNCSLVNVADELTVVGTPIVGATRMVDAAKEPNQAVVNLQLGKILFKEKNKLLKKNSIEIEKIDILTKEYSEGQEAFSLKFKKILS